MTTPPPPSSPGVPIDGTGLVASSTEWKSIRSRAGTDADKIATQSAERQ